MNKKTAETEMAWVSLMWGLKFDRNGVNYDVAINEIFGGKKNKDWMWYVFPSDLETSSNTATLFRLGPKAQSAPGSLGNSTCRIDIYLEDKHSLTSHKLANRNHKLRSVCQHLG